MKKIILLCLVALLAIRGFAQENITEKTVYISAGGLSSVLTEEEKRTIIKLTIVGEMDRRDFQTIVDHESYNSSDVYISKMPRLQYLNLENVKIKAYNEFQENHLPSYAFNGLFRHTPGYNEDTGGGRYLSPDMIFRIILPSTLEAIDDNAFFHIDIIGDLVIPESVTSIGASAFERCWIASITIPNSVTSIGEGAFSSCSNLTSITIPSSITSIEDYTFYDCINLTSITIPSSVTSIGHSTFSRCSSLASITIPNSITSIGRWAFSNCSSLTAITIPSGVTTLGEDAFMNCSNLSEIYCDIPIPIFISTNSQFRNVNHATCKLYVPKGSVGAYRAAAGWKDFVNILEFGTETEVPNLSVAPSGTNDDPFILSAEGGLTKSFTVTSNVDWNAEITNTATSWLSVTKNSSTSFTIETLNTNHTGNSRDAVVTVSGSGLSQTIYIRQEKLEDINIGLESPITGMPSEVTVGQTITFNATIKNYNSTEWNIAFSLQDGNNNLWSLGDYVKIGGGQTYTIQTNNSFIVPDNTGSTTWVLLYSLQDGQAGGILARINIQVNPVAATTYTVAFNSDGGSAVPSQQVTAGSVIIEPTPNPTKSGYAFAGWFHGATEWDFNNPVNTHMTLTAKWAGVADEIWDIRMESSITGIPSVVTAGQNITFNAKIKNYNSVERNLAFYLKDGNDNVWSLGNYVKIGGGQTYTIQTNNSFNVPDNTGLRTWILYYLIQGDQNGSELGQENYSNRVIVQVNPIEEVVTYTVYFNSDGGSSVPSKQIAAGNVVAKPTPDPTKSGYTFAGWFHGTTKWDFNNPINAHMTLTAKWTAEPETLSSDATLKSLTISHGSLSPNFSPATSDYSVIVANEISSINIIATANNSKAKVSGTGSKSLTIGNNSFPITVVAENGTTNKLYVVRVTRNAAADKFPVIPQIISKIVSNQTDEQGYLSIKARVQSYYPISEVRYRVDNENDKTQSIANPATDISFSHIYQGASLSPGSHTLYIQFKNQEGFWSKVESVDFAKLTNEQVNLNLSATQQNSLVQLSWNSIAGLNMYQLTRNGNVIKTIKTSAHPATMSFSDNPQAGNHNYKVTAYDGQNYVAKVSPTKSITVSAIEDPDKYGTILGKVVDGNGIEIQGATLTFTHNSKTIPTEMGKYRLEGIPYGTTGIITTIKNGYSFLPKPYTVTAENPTVTLEIVGTKIPNSDELPQDYDLELKSNFTESLDKNKFNVNEIANLYFDLNNIQQSKWEGDVVIVLDDYSGNTLMSSDEIARLKISLNARETKRIFIDIPANTVSKALKTYNMRIMSSRKAIFSNYSLKMVAAKGGFSNPQQITLVGTKVKDLEYWEEELAKALSRVKQVNSYANTYTEYAKDIDLITGSHLQDMLLSEIIADIAKYSKVPLDMEKKAKEYLKYIEVMDQAFSGTVTEGNAFWAFCKVVNVALSKAVIIGESGFPIGPIPPIFTVYLDALEKSRETIERMGNYIFSNYPGEMAWLMNEGAVCISVKVEKGYFWGTDFETDDLNDAIRSATIMAKNTNSITIGESPLNKCPSGCCGNDDKALYFNLSHSLNDHLDHHNVVYFIKIEWSNGRISWVPLTNNFAKIKGNHNSGTIQIKFKSKSTYHISNSEWHSRWNNVVIVSKSHMANKIKLEYYD